MAQAKKPAVKKTATRSTTRSAAAKKAPAAKATPRTTPVKKAPVKKTVAKKAPAKKTATKTARLQSFRVARDQPSFTTFRITKQTVYWIILVAFIIFAQLWILKLQVEVTTLLEAQQTQLREQF